MKTKVAAQCGEVVAAQCGEAVDVHSHEPTLMFEGPMGNVYFRSLHKGGLDKGQIVGGHTHNFDHVTFLWHGSVRLRAWHKDESSEDADGLKREPTDRSKITVVNYGAPAKIWILKDWCHEFMALEDRTFGECIFALRDYDGQVTDVFNGDMTPYK